MSDVMQQEILQQPEVCARLFDREQSGLQKFLKTLKQKPPVGIAMAARGSSDHAANYGRYLLEYLTGIPVSLSAPSLLTTFKRPSKLKNYLVIGISQSGQGPDICAVLQDATRQGAATLALTNDPRSPLAKVSRHVLDLGAEKEQAVAATKTYTAELAGLALLGALWHGKSEEIKRLLKIPALMQKMLSASQDPVAQVAKRLKAQENTAVLGRGFQLSNAHEMALKMKECASVGALSYSTADFQHGPISLAKAGYVVFLISAPGKLQKESTAVTADLIERGAHVFRLGLKDPSFKNLKPNPRLDSSMAVEGACSEHFSPLLTILPGQWFAYYLALAKGLDPAKPKGLKKVTKTK